LHKGYFSNIHTHKHISFLISRPAAVLGESRPPAYIILPSTQSSLNEFPSRLQWPCT
jgi:hypothetical protein